MTDHPSLFDPPRRYPYRAGHKEGTTSKAAADRMESSGKAPTLRARVRALFAGGFTGTADECAAKLGATVLAVRPRVTELHKQGWLEHAGTRHTNASGATAHVWRFNRDHQEQRAS